jgi:hypothetical protein
LVINKYVLAEGALRAVFSSFTENQQSTRTKPFSTGLLPTNQPFDHIESLVIFGGIKTPAA